MANVELLLRDHVKGLGRCGDVVRVSTGYARNYLIPNRIAVQATEENKRSMVRRRERLDLEEAARTKEYEARVEALNNLTLTTKQRADENGRLYGSVNAGTIAELSNGAIAEKELRIAAPIKEVGEYKVGVHVHAEIEAEVTLVVEAEEA
jgi:large subunit ribosomal protein L9